MKKVLIITYYWPPSGGAGVQRWVKLTKYLALLDVEVHVITVDENYSSYVVKDFSLMDDISEKIKIHKTKSFEPIKIYGKIAGKKNIPTAGFSNVDNSSLKQKLVNFVRSNLFIPDPRRCWNRYAYKKACEVIEKYSIDNVITSSPPHSSQLLGLKLKKKFNINWIADLRDPWTDIYYYPLLNHSFLSARIDYMYEKKVLKNADKVITVGQSLKNLFLSKDHTLKEDKIYLIPNGFDPEDFENQRFKIFPEDFTITYTGTMSGSYNPNIFFDVLIELINDLKINKIRLNIVGMVAEEIKSYIINTSLKDHVCFIPSVPHNEVTGYQIRSHLLLLIIPDIVKSEGILTGKLFEYLATGNKIICIGPKNGDAAGIIEMVDAGKVFERDEKSKIYKYLEFIFNSYLNSTLPQKPNDLVSRFNRKLQADLLYDLI
ncbi:MAG: glycosyltransferase family 4 protein [Deltaproteobacteria bacterium]